MKNSINIKKIGVVGAGTMGAGIANVSSLAGFKTTILDLNNIFLQKGFNVIKKNLRAQVQKNKISKVLMNNTLDRIELVTDFNKITSCDLVVEAINEKENLKLDLFKKLDNICNKKTILATNTSSISITKIASSTNRPEKVIGMHFMNPVPIMKLVEIIKGKKTDECTLQLIINVSEKMKKIPIECNDSPGFISNRILMPMINEAIFCLYEEVGTPEAIDSIMKLGMAHPMGPLALADLIGLDICLNIINVLFIDFGDEKYKPCPLLDAMVKKGHLGCKTGRGFYDYS